MYSYLPTQQRLAQMETMYPQYAMPTPVRASIVMNREEANAQQVAMDGSISLFLNKATNEIYAKKLGANGLPEFYTYSLVTTTKNDIYAELKEEIKELKAKVEGLIDVKSADDANVSASKPVKKQSKSDGND